MFTGTIASTRLLPLAAKGLLGAGMIGLLPTAASAHPHWGLRVDIGFPVPVVVAPAPAPCPPQTVQVWVEPVYQTVTDRQWVGPVYRTVTDRSWAPDRFEVREVVRYSRHGRYVSRENVLVEPGHFCDVNRQVLVCDGHLEEVQHQVVVAPGHYETRVVAAADQGYPR